MDFEALDEKQRLGVIKKAVKKMYAAQATADDSGTFRAIAKENRFAANERVASSFFKDITDQKVKYMAELRHRRPNRCTN